MDLSCSKKKTPKLKAEGRWLVMFYALRTGRYNNELRRSSSSYNQKRQTLRRRTCRFFFCSSAFSGVLFETKLKGQTAEARIWVGPESIIESTSIGQSTVRLTCDHVCGATLARAVGVARLKRVGVVMCRSRDPLTMERLDGNWSAIFSALQSEPSHIVRSCIRLDHRTLKEVLWNHKCFDWASSQLTVRDFFYGKILSVSLDHSRGTPLLQAISSQRMEKAGLYALWENSPCQFGAFVYDY